MEKPPQRTQEIKFRLPKSNILVRPKMERETGRLDDNMPLPTENGKEKSIASCSSHDVYLAKILDIVTLIK